ncbi:MiaB-like tRNA modifying enzyme [Candidatus Uzinura diaspidicola str. ASNER]|uniref:Threonylcarbamoyladenosine tRNA methylthiotransferase MtaB n=1 Tax=Candidatus Uzinura diaspidicola str. ASNER TaxID=1133592 RepID=L7VJS9_9FLAO|nr:MiaB-like tRNA modifying enzyme [Candidatus Uzinura diaspidicola str. ASNER]
MGCKLNLAETSSLSKTIRNQGYKAVSFQETADIYIINTCSVTKNAEKEFRNVVSIALKKNSKAFIIAIGCYAQVQSQEVAYIEGVDLVLGVSEKFKITDYLQYLSKKDVGEINPCEIESVDFHVDSYSLGDRTRAFLKVQDGCDYQCSYCTIPLARGRSRSDSMQNVLKNAKEIAKSGVKEIVLTGINIGDYGKVAIENKKPTHTFFELLEALDRVEQIKRLRISSIEPNLLNNDILLLIAKSKKFVPHFHIPLQSGSNEILSKMRRRYFRDLYKNKVENIKSLMPQASIGTDVIVGFPGESNEHFLKTFHFLNEIQVSYLHVFTFSERENTEAFRMYGVIPKYIRHKRNNALRNLSEIKRQKFYDSQIGTERTVLFESENREGFLYGFTDNYIRVKIPYNEAIPNSLQNVKLKTIDKNGIMLIEKIL